MFILFTPGEKWCGDPMSAISPEVSKTWIFVSELCKLFSQNMARDKAHRKEERKTYDYLIQFSKEKLM